MTYGEEHTDVSEDQNVSATESKPDKDDLNKTVAKSEHTKDFESIRSIFSLGFRFSLQRSNSAILSYIFLCYITRYRVSCPDYGKLVFAVCLWLSSSTLRELGYMYPFCSFPTQSRKIEFSD